MLGAAKSSPTISELNPTKNSIIWKIFKGEISIKTLPKIPFICHGFKRELKEEPISSRNGSIHYVGVFMCVGDTGRERMSSTDMQPTGLPNHPGCGE